MTDTTQAKASLTISEHKFKRYAAGDCHMVTHWGHDDTFHVDIFRGNPYSEICLVGTNAKMYAGSRPSHKRAVITSATMLGLETGRISESDARLLIAAAMEEEAV